MEQLAERRLEQRQHRLRLRIAEATIEFDDCGPVRGDRQPGIQQPRESAAAPDQFGGNGFHDLGDGRSVDVGR
jgi:hypothetical protein